MQVWSDNWTLPSTSLVKITLSAQPSGLTATFNSSECASGFGTPTCAIETPGTAASPTNLEADVPVPASASTNSVTLSAAVASPAGATLSAPLGAAGTAQVTGTPSTSSGSTSSSGRSSSSSASSHSSSLTSLGPLGDGTANNVGIGPLPELNNANTSLIGAGNAASLFPQINPSAAPSPVPGAGVAPSKGKADGSPTESLLPLGMPVVTAQVLGLIALAIAFLLAMTRISLRRRPGGH